MPTGTGCLFNSFSSKSLSENRAPGTPQLLLGSDTPGTQVQVRIENRSLQEVSVLLHKNTFYFSALNLWCRLHLTDATCVPLFRPGSSAPATRVVRQRGRAVPQLPLCPSRLRRGRFGPSSTFRPSAARGDRAGPPRLPRPGHSAAPSAFGPPPRQGAPACGGGRKRRLVPPPPAARRAPPPGEDGREGRAAAAPQHRGAGAGPRLSLQPPEPGRSCRARGGPRRTRRRGGAGPRPRYRAGGGGRRAREGPGRARPGRSVRAFGPGGVARRGGAAPSGPRGPPGERPGPAVPAALRPRVVRRRCAVRRRRAGPGARNFPRAARAGRAGPGTALPRGGGELRAQAPGRRGPRRQGVPLRAAAVGSAGSELPFVASLAVFTGPGARRARCGPRSVRV